jgi:hypothetical protein
MIMQMGLPLVALIFLAFGGIPLHPRHDLFSNESRRGALQQSVEDQNEKVAIEFSKAGDAIDGDPEAARFEQEFLDQLQASGRFYWWGSAVRLLPENSLHVVLISVEVKDANGEVVGSAIVLSAARRCAKDPEAEHPIDVKTWFVRHNQPVDDIVRTYFRELQEKVM